MQYKYCPSPRKSASSVCENRLLTMNIAQQPSPKQGRRKSKERGAKWPSRSSRGQEHRNRKHANSFPTRRRALTQLDACLSPHSPTSLPPCPLLIASCRAPFPACSSTPASTRPLCQPRIHILHLTDDQSILQSRIRRLVGSFRPTYILHQLTMLDVGSSNIRMSRNPCCSCTKMTRVS